MSRIVKIIPTWKVLPTFSRNFPQAKITTFTVTVFVSIDLFRIFTIQLETIIAGLQAKGRMERHKTAISVLPLQVNYLKLTWKVIYHWKRQPYFFYRTFFQNGVLARSMSRLISFAWANSGCKERKPINTKWNTGTRTHDPWFSSLVPYPFGHPVWFKTYPVEYRYSLGYL